MTRPAIRWPRRDPFNKRWYQRKTGAHLTAMRAARVEGLLAVWEPRLFARGVNVPPCLLAERKRLAALEDGVDWTMFPKWVKG
jgi:hypothetical protein